jgi:hypothetical protein
VKVLLGIFIILFLWESVNCEAFAETARLVSESPSPKDSPFQSVQWTSRDIEVLTERQEDKLTRVALLEAVVPKDWSLLLTEGSITKECQAKENKNDRLLTCKIPLNSEKTRVNLIAVALTGEVGTQSFDIQLMPNKQNHWRGLVDLSIPFGVYSATTAAGGQGSTYIGLNLFKMGGQISFRREILDTDPSIETTLAAEIGYLAPYLGVAFPPTGAMTLSFTGRNFKPLTLKKDAQLNPRISLGYESFSSLTNQLAPAGTFLFSYEYRRTQPIWIGLGCQLQLRIWNRAFEVVPDVSYSPFATSALSWTGSTTTLTGWKIDLLSKISVWKQFWTGARFTGIYLSNESTQTTSYFGSLVLTYRFN